MGVAGYDAVVEIDAQPMIRAEVARSSPSRLEHAAMLSLLLAAEIVWLAALTLLLAEYL